MARDTWPSGSAQRRPGGRRASRLAARSAAVLVKTLGAAATTRARSAMAISHTFRAHPGAGGCGPEPGGVIGQFVGQR